VSCINQVIPGSLLTPTNQRQHQQDRERVERWAARAALSPKREAPVSRRRLIRGVRKTE
jgi:hypothetical protein